MQIRIFWINVVGWMLGLLMSGNALAGTEAVSQHWDKLLKMNAVNGRINYKAIVRDDTLLKASLIGVETMTQQELDSLSDKELMAFWINAYNIGAVKMIVAHYPIKQNFGLSAFRYPANSIQQIDHVWDRSVLSVGGINLSLNDIENKILRPRFKDPRIHFAIVCASIGCPSIRSEAYTAVKLDQQLSEQIQLFVGDPGKVAYDAPTDVLYLSPIFKWFKEDFNRVGGVIRFIKKYDVNHAFDAITEKTKVLWQDYDWSLNDRHE